MSKFILSKDKKGEWRFVLKANNGKIIFQSEKYKTKASAIKGINCIKDLSLLSKIVVEL